MCESGTAGDIANGVNTRDIGFAKIIYNDFALVGLDAYIFQSNVFKIRSYADGRQHNVRFNFDFTRRGFYSRQVILIGLKNGREVHLTVVLVLQQIVLEMLSA